MTSEFIHIEMRHEDDGGFSVDVQLPDVEETTDLLLAVLSLLSEADEYIDEHFSQFVRLVLNDIAAGNLDSPVRRVMEGMEDD